jgi:hypothetical protein
VEWSILGGKGEGFWDDLFGMTNGQNPRPNTQIILAGESIRIGIWSLGLGYFLIGQPMSPLLWQAVSVVSCRTKTAKENGASDEGRTHNLLHGKQMLYQLSYTRIREGRSIPMRGGFGKRIFGRRILALEIINHHAGAVGLENLLHKFQVPRVFLIDILRGLIVKHEVQRHLISLIHHIPMAARHGTAVIMPHAGDVLEIFLRTGQQFFRGTSHLGFGPKNYNVRKHGRDPKRRRAIESSLWEKQGLAEQATRAQAA